MFCFLKNSSHNPIRTNNSLLESYIDVVNENTKKLGKKFSENIFRLADNFWFDIGKSKICQKLKSSKWKVQNHI